MLRSSKIQWGFSGPISFHSRGKNNEVIGGKSADPTKPHMDQVHFGSFNQIKVSDPSSANLKINNDGTHAADLLSLGSLSFSVFQLPDSAPKRDFLW